MLARSNKSYTNLTIINDTEFFAYNYSKITEITLHNYNLLIQFIATAYMLDEGARQTKLEEERERRAREDKE